jgi:hypothetical protein
MPDPMCCKNNRIILTKAVTIIDNRGLISLVQKAGRASERAKKRAVTEITEEAKGGVNEEDNGKAPRAHTRAGGRAAKRVKFSRGTKRGSK